VNFLAQANCKVEAVFSGHRHLGYGFIGNKTYPDRIPITGENMNNPETFVPNTIGPVFMARCVHSYRMFWLRR